MSENLILRLYVTGMTPRSERAIADLERLCEQEFAGRYRVTVIDLLEHPQAGREDRILASPTVVKQGPEPVRRVIGYLADAQRVLAGLDLVPRNDG